MPEMIIYTRGSAQSPGLKAIDIAVMQRDGSYKGLYYGLSEQEMKAEYGDLHLTDEATYIASRDASFTTAPSLVSEDEYDNALNCLPPMTWGSWNGVESFRLSEFYSGDITSIFARTPDGRCWKFRDNAYLSGEVVAQMALKASAANPLTN